MKRVYYKLPLFLLLFFASVFCASAQRTPPDSARKSYQTRTTDTSGRGQYLQKAKSALGLSEPQALALREFVRNARAQLSRISRDSSLNALQKQQMTRSVILRSQQERNSLLTPAQQQQFRSLVAGKLPDQKQKIAQTLEASKYPLRGGSFISSRQIK